MVKLITTTIAEILNTLIDYMAFPLLENLRLLK